MFLVGVFWRRVNAQGAMTALILGFVLGMGRLASELAKGSLSGWMLWYADINFLHFAILLFVVCTTALILVSLATRPPPYAKVVGLTYALADAAAAPEAAGAPPAPHLAMQHTDPGWRRRDRLLSMALIVCVGLIWWYFR